MPLLDSFECGQGKCRQGRTNYHEKVTKSHGSITDDDRRSTPRPSVIADAPRLAIENASAWQAALTGRDIRLRPDDSTWSPLEYAAHVRDVHIKFAERVDAIKTLAIYFIHDPIHHLYDRTGIRFGKN